MAVKVFEPLQLIAAGAAHRSIRLNEGPWSLVGAHSPTSLALLLSSEPLRSLGRPNLIVLADEASAKPFMDAFQFYDPTRQPYLLPSFDVGPYSGLYPNAKNVAARLSWYHKANQAKPNEIFVATVESLAQLALPLAVYQRSCRSVRKGDIVPDDFVSQLLAIGYHSAPTVEDFGSFSARGGIIDVFSPAQDVPFRIELVGDQIESLRSFDTASQKSIHEQDSFDLIPAKETLYQDHRLENLVSRFNSSCEGRPVDPTDLTEVRRSIRLQQPFYGMEFLSSFFYGRTSSPLEYFSDFPVVWLFDKSELYHASDELERTLRKDFDSSLEQTIRPSPDEIYQKISDWPWPDKRDLIACERLEFTDSTDSNKRVVDFKTFALSDFQKVSIALAKTPDKHAEFLHQKIQAWYESGHRVFIAAHNQNAAQRIRLLLERVGLPIKVVSEDNFRFQSLLEDASQGAGSVIVVPRRLPEGFRIAEERIVFISDFDIWGEKRGRRRPSDDANFLERAQALAFGDLKPGDFVVHKLHGIGVYDGLKVMDIEGVPAEFIQLRYKDNDRLFLPVYRVGNLQKYSGPSSDVLIDKLGGPGWQKTTSKVKKQVRDLAAVLLKLYAARARAQKIPFSAPDEDYQRFEDLFPYDETEDQLQAIQHVLSDMQKPTPMDRLICGDVGFGKTEVALRAAFKAVEDGRQVALIAPTTILTFQHAETFRRRFKDWPIQVRVLNRFVSAEEARKTLAGIADGTVDIVIGTHRLLSKDVVFKNLGLLVVDEEQKFGVAHKEKIRQLKESVDTLVLSATPIPRTLNMSLVGLRDISLINTPPEDRLPTRTFVCRFDPETIKKAVLNEVQRGGQVFFLHNRIQSIYEVADQLRSFLPDVRMAVAHGQMPEDELEKTMLRFFNHEIDLLLCTSIIESGMDIPRANTIFIDRAHQFGVSQLYQLRGRVGRSKERAHCYLIIPTDKRLDSDAQERLRIIQENTALGSGIKVAHYDLELRGGGDILGAEQAGHINSVGYEMYMELLDQAIAEQKGESLAKDDVEPEINLRIPAFIPDSYIPDIRIRLSYYKALSNIRSVDELDRLEDELRDQFGVLPDSVLNLMGLMLIRKVCRELGVKDISAGSAWLTLSFSERTRLPPSEVIRLTAMENKKYNISPDQKLKIRMHEVSWPRVNDELQFLLRLCPG